MASAARVEGDVLFSLSTDDSRPTLVGSVSAEGTAVTVTVREGAVALPNGRAGLTMARVLGAELGRLGLTASLVTRHGVVGTIGAVRAPWLHRIVTRSRHLKLGSLTALRALRRDGRLPEAQPLDVPPGTLLPLTPTILRGMRRERTTTHYLPGSGRPRLIFAVQSGVWDGKAPREFDLLPDVTTIGSAESADLVLPGLGPVHAKIVHDDQDEYVLYVSDNGAGLSAPVLVDDPVAGRVLRTGALITLGQWRLAFFREEFADHGRPFGGRAGGEFAVQRPQPPRRAGTQQPAG
ncbi:MAG: FHA domain-containing protein [Microcella sp.]|uniref:FHA domain-containing protein n=1 Tax=Microcella sp. TaxID=1913979 RepID=UPI003314FBBB